MLDGPCCYRLAKRQKAMSFETAKHRIRFYGLPDVPFCTDFRDSRLSYNGNHYWRTITSPNERRQKNAPQRRQQSL